MPYIVPQRRETISHDWPAETAGELNYVLTMTVLRYLETKGKSYQAINDIVGALVGCKDEFTRRVVRPYEDQKIKQNGDVYDANDGL